MKHKLLLATLLCATAVTAQAKDIINTGAYRWSGDTIYQDEFIATAPSATEIVSTYYATPGYRMPISHTWKLTNDISGYPQLSTPNTLHAAIYNMGLDEMVNAVEPDTTLRTGKEWAGVWTRDVSYSILLSMAQMQPLASKISLMKKVRPDGVIIQDTGSGGAWPISTDRMIWALAAYEVYKVTGDREWLEYIYPVIKKSIAYDRLTVESAAGLVKGETSFIDWREQSYPKWMQTADIAESEALSTTIVYIQALRTLAEISRELGHDAESDGYDAVAAAIADKVNSELWIPEKGYYAMYSYGRDNKILNPRAETLGESLAILYDIADADRARAITENNPTTPYGVGIFFPQISDMPPYHNNALWPWVASYWALANAKVGNEEGVLEAIGSVFRPAALFATNKENFVLDNGDIATELNSSNMLWCLAGNIALTQRILFGITYEKDSLAFRPFVPEALAGERTLSNYPYRDATLDITVRGFGNKIKSFTLNGSEHAPFLPCDIKGRNTVVIELDNVKPAQLNVNHTANVKAPLTPLTRLNSNTLSWHPVEYIARYIILRDGERIAETRTTNFDASVPGEYQVIGVSADGVESFASEPLSNMPSQFVDAGNSTALRSEEVSYQPEGGVIEGFKGGFVELDMKTDAVTIPFTVPETGIYSISLLYANGNGPVNTENKAAIRTLSIDGARAGVVVMPHRGVANWDDWGNSTAVQIPLNAGEHSATIDFRPENNNMNLHTNHAIVDGMTVRLIRK